MWTKVIQQKPRLCPEVTFQAIVTSIVQLVHVAAIDIEDRNGLLFIKKGGQTDASVLYEMPKKERN
jgi:hypothetical protein